MPRRLDPLKAYALAVLSVFAGLLVRLVLAPLLGSTVPYITFFPAIVVSAAFGGLRAGLLCTGLSALTAFYLVMPPSSLMILLTGPEGIALAIFLFIGAMLSWLNEALLRGRQALRDQEEKTRLIVDTALDAVVTINSEGKVIGWNTTAESTFGWPHADILGRKLSETIIPSQYRPDHERGLKRFLATGEAVVLGKRIELTGLHRDGREFPIELAITPLRQGNQISFSAFIRDISGPKTAARKLETQLARLDLLRRTTRAIGERQDLPSILQVVVGSIEDHLSIDFACVCLRDQASQSLSVTRIGSKSAQLAEELELSHDAKIAIDQNGLSRCLHGELVHEPDLKTVSFPFPEWLAGAGLRSLVLAPLAVESNVFGVLIAARREPGSFLSSDCEFLRQLSEHVALALHQAEIYGALERAYNDLRQTQQVVLQQERLRALGEMASGIAHDVNNALSPVTGYTALLQEEAGLSEKAKRYLGIIEQATDDVVQTISRLNDFSKQREVTSELFPIQLNVLADQVLNLTRARWSDIPQQRGAVISVHKDLFHDLPEIAGRESEIREALINLVFNAVDAMPNGGRLTLRTRAVETESHLRYVHFEVADEGTGMDEETRRRCLEPFYTTKGDRGSGLGLAMVYGIVQRHNAELELDSTLGVGTTVRLVFPIASSGSEQTLSADVPRASFKLRILIIDDDPLVNRSLREILESEGHEVTGASGGQQGIDLFSQADCPFDMVITDLGMPHVDGRKVAATIKSESASTPVIMLTGWGQRMKSEGASEPNIDRILSKPPKLQELRTAILELASDGRKKS